MLNRIVPALAALALIAPGFAADSGEHADDPRDSTLQPTTTPGSGDVTTPHQRTAKGLAADHAQTTSGADNDLSTDRPNDRPDATAAHRGAPATPATTGGSETDLKTTTGSGDVQRGRNAGAVGVANDMPRTTTGSSTDETTIRDEDARSRHGTSAGAEALSQQDRDFIAAAASGGMFEVKSSQYLLDQKTKDVREKEFAQQMIDDHTKANRALQKLAERKGLDVGKTLAADDQSKLDALQGQSGDVLQKTYDDQQRQAHQDAISLFKQEAAQGQDPDVKNFAAETLPTLEKHANHLRMLEDNDRNLNLSK